ncbi:molybdopterin-dependent oxidoreductase [Alicyclobacillus sp. SO9]|uniref:molybdopterin-dependent oxidoreductase n=1 Tax=Alicyclobacillus sp. SO9 TaxID=2665646 RepID=UPI0018E75476|nr:molybdopterin-dependent oxidoreductase [Alicyclobacillus sp. SO9]QQE78266.1 molybdopterin-dependent oxidoreductase [Alicyclobacillus sp. SO9]
MKIRWLKHGKWPGFLVGLHYYTIGSFILLMITGLALYLPAFHTVLIPYLSMIYQVHILLGLVFGITLLLPLFRLLPSGKTIWRLDWLIPIAAGIAIVFTGILLWGVTVFPTAWRSPAFQWHGYFSYGLGIWVLIHVAYKTFGFRPNKLGYAGKVYPERRLFLRWLGTGLVGGAALTLIDPFATLPALFTSLRSGGETTTGGSGTQFPEYFTVTGTYPSMQLQDYQLKVGGLVEHPLTLRWSDLQSLKNHTETENFHCVTGWSVNNITWEGVRISQLVARVKPQSAAKYVHFYSFDGVYTESLHLTEALHQGVLLAWSLNGQPLKREAGYPLRLVVPNMYGYKSIKWVSRIEFSDKPIKGFWEQRGYKSQAYFRRSQQA